MVNGIALCSRFECYCGSSIVKLHGQIIMVASDKLNVYGFLFEQTKLCIHRSGIVASGEALDKLFHEACSLSSCGVVRHYILGEKVITAHG